MIEEGDVPRIVRLWRYAKGKGKGVLNRGAIQAGWYIRKYLHRMRKKRGWLPSTAERQIVVAVSMHRTGTRSLAQYCHRLGFKDVHWPWWCEPEVSMHLDDPDQIVEILEPLFYHYDFFSDVPFPGLYRVLDQRFPNSRFILVRRDPVSWWQSVCRHWQIERGPHRLDPFEEIVYRQYHPSDMVVVTQSDASVLISKFKKHTEEVMTFFSGRPEKLLVVDLEDDDINLRISQFLGTEVISFPREVSKDWQ